jgi:hypothetical protein
MEQAKMYNRDRWDGDSGFSKIAGVMYGFDRLAEGKNNSNPGERLA